MHKLSGLAGLFVFGSLLSTAGAFAQTIDKPGNNGTVSCNTYCRGAQWPGVVGLCVGGRHADNPRQRVPCDEVPGLLPGGKSLTCECVPTVDKPGNNGTVSCETYCRGAQWGGFSSECIGGRKPGDPSQRVNCSQVLPGTALTCECKPPPPCEFKAPTDSTLGWDDRNGTQIQMIAWCFDKDNRIPMPNEYTFTFDFAPNRPLTYPSGKVTCGLGPTNTVTWCKYGSPTTIAKVSPNLPFTHGTRSVTVRAKGFSPATFTFFVGPAPSSRTREQEAAKEYLRREAEFDAAHKKYLERVAAAQAEIARDKAKAAAEAAAQKAAADKAAADKAAADKAAADKAAADKAAAGTYNERIPRAADGQTVTLRCPANLGIVVKTGTFGRNCGAPHGNGTTHLSNACNGTGECRYKVESRLIGHPGGACGGWGREPGYMAAYDCHAPDVALAAAPLARREEHEAVKACIDKHAERVQWLWLRYMAVAEQLREIPKYGDRGRLLLQPDGIASWIGRPRGEVDKRSRLWLELNLTLRECQQPIQGFEGTETEVAKWEKMVRDHYAPPATASQAPPSAPLFGEQMVTKAWGLLKGESCDKLATTITGKTPLRADASFVTIANTCGVEFAKGLICSFPDSALDNVKLVLESATYAYENKKVCMTVSMGPLLLAGPAGIVQFLACGAGFMLAHKLPKAVGCIKRMLAGGDPLWPMLVELGCNFAGSLTADLVLAVLSGGANTGYIAKKIYERVGKLQALSKKVPASVRNVAAKIEKVKERLGTSASIYRKLNHLAECK